LERLSEQLHLTTICTTLEINVKTTQGKSLSPKDGKGTSFLQGERTRSKIKQQKRGGGRNPGASVLVALKKKAGGESGVSWPGGGSLYMPSVRKAGGTELGYQEHSGGRREETRRPGMCFQRGGEGQQKSASTFSCRRGKNCKKGWKRRGE